MIPANVLKKMLQDGMLKEQFYHRTHGKTFPKWARLSSLSPRKKELTKQKAVLWHIGNEDGAIADHIEMAGLRVSAILSYGKNSKNQLVLHRHVSFPSFRVKPNLTASHVRYDFKALPRLFLDDTEIRFEHPKTVEIRGVLKLESDFMGGARITRTLFPSTSFTALIEKVEVQNLTDSQVMFTAKDCRKKPKKVNDKRLLVRPLEFESRLVEANGDFRSDKRTTLEKKLVKNATATCYFVHYCQKVGEPLNFNAEKELKERLRFVDTMFKSFRLTSDNEVVDAQLSHCLVRGCESIFQNETHLLHSPGGGGFYAAVWANDQCEYANPFFPFVGYDLAVEQSLTTYRLYAEYAMRGECCPQSLVAGGTKPYITAGDRGDTEMFLYGLCRFLLAYGCPNTAKSFWQAITKAHQFVQNKKNSEGLIYSDSDELEGRFPSGEYNLSTNCLYYDALIHTARLADCLGEESESFTHEAAALKEAILKHFRATVEGHDTYRYYEGNTVLRSWICMPSIVGIQENAAQTYEALFSKPMFENATLRTASNSKTVWDRTLLYALRGAFLSNAPSAFDTLVEYCTQRLLGAHSPYPYEAYPEGNRAQLAAESVLFARIISEGMFSFDPISFTKLQIIPSAKAKLSNVSFGGTLFDVDNTNGNLTIKIGSKTYDANGGTVFDFQQLLWNI